MPTRAALRDFERSFDPAIEDRAAHARGAFLNTYPLERLHTLTLDEYVIGKGTASFCKDVEVTTRPWASIQGANASKFGIYYGRTKSDPERRYRFVKRFGRTEGEAFQAIKLQLDHLQRAGKARDFRAIDNNLLTQMFKAKLLSLYFADNYINICSGEHLEQLGGHLTERTVSLNRQSPSELQHRLIRAKRSDPVTRNWSNPKYMHWLYRQYMPEHLKAPAPIAGAPRHSKRHRRVDFDQLFAQRQARGREAEAFALAYEKARLKGLDLADLVGRIEDRRDRPGYGYDFLSHSSRGRTRRIEVKSLQREHGTRSYRFFLSDNELEVSTDDEGDYFFYLVRFGGDGKPAEVLPQRASDLYSNSLRAACAFVVTIQLL